MNIQHVRRLTRFFLAGAVSLGLALTGEAAASGTPAPITCEGHYDGHLQGCDTDGKHIYWSFTYSIVKTDLTGRKVAETRQPGHQGDCCVVGDTLYIAVNLGRFNTETGGISSVWTYDTKDLALKKKFNTPELVHGGGGMTFYNGRFYVIGGLPATHVKNYVYEYTPDFTFVKRHDLHTGQTHLGIQTAAFIDGRFLFGCYGNKEYPQCTLICPPDLSTFKKSPVNTSVGMIQLNGQFYRAHNVRLPENNRNRASLIPSAPLK